MDNLLCPDCGQEATHSLFRGLCPVVVVPVDVQPLAFWCDHPDLEGTPLYRDGRKVWKCVTCEALLVHEDAEPVGVTKLVPLVTAPFVWFSKAELETWETSEWKHDI